MSEKKCTLQWGDYWRDCPEHEPKSKNTQYCVYYGLKLSICTREDKPINFNIEEDFEL